MKHKIGWLHAGYLDAGGQLWLLGRGSDVIRTGSETVHASEVEHCLQQHPDILAAAVVGLPHARLGEQVPMSSSSCRMLPHDDRLVVMWGYS